MAKSLVVVNAIIWILSFLYDIQACSSFTALRANTLTPIIHTQRQQQSQQQQQSPTCITPSIMSSSNVKRRPGKSPTTTNPASRARGGAATTTTTTLSMTTIPVFDNSPLWASQQIILAANGLGLIISWITNSHVHLDLLGTGAFFVSVLPALGLAQTNTRIAYSCGAVSMWAVKLASFLFFRALQLKHDGRLTSTLATPIGTAGFWFISAIWGMVTALPHALGTTNPNHVGTTLSNGIGMTLFAIGWLVETMADIQKWTFKQQNPGAFCNIGLWQYSQHPNWLGNLLLWAGIFVLNAPALVEPVATAPNNDQPWWLHVWSCRRLALALLSPLFLWTLFSGQANGTITDSLNMSHQKYGYGTNDAYTEYIDNTPLVFPIPKSWFSSK